MKEALTILGVLNLLDGIFTYIGLSIGMIKEVNPLMDFIYQSSPYLFLIVKFILSVSLFILIFKNVIPEFPFFKYLSIMSVTLYTIISCLHLFWLVS